MKSITGWGGRWIIKISFRNAGSVPDFLMSREPLPNFYKGHFRCQTFMIKKPEALTCPGSRAKTLSQKSLSENFFSGKVSDTGFMTRLCQASLTLFFQNIKQFGPAPPKNVPLVIRVWI